jgi:two-component system nitrogen regulation response regulator GlnG
VPLTGVRRIEPALLQRGVVLELSNRTAVLLHERPQPQVVEDCGLVGGSEALETVRKQILRAAPFLVPVLISGETGVGKELVARALHDAGPRRDGPWVAVNVAEIKSETAASVLFGHVRGAFTGASQDHDGLFVRADGGTLFLDEIGEMAPDVQAMLLRVLETGEVQRLGDRRVRKVDVRVVAATDQDLEERGNLRTPLLYRLAGYQVRVPPLRHRLEDLGMLLRHFCQEETAHARQPAEEPWLPAGLITQLAKHKWPGNARELRNLVRTLVIQAEGDPRLGRGFSLESWLGLADAPTPARSAPALEPSHVTEDAVSGALARNHWNLTATARDMGIARSTLYLMIDRSTALRTAADVTPGELRAVWERASGNVDVMAQMLHVSPRGLRLALRAAGLLESGMTSEDGEPAS